MHDCGLEKPAFCSSSKKLVNRDRRPPHLLFRKRSCASLCCGFGFSGKVFLSSSLFSHFAGMTWMTAPVTCVLIKCCWLRGNPWKVGTTTGQRRGYVLSTVGKCVLFYCTAMQMFAEGHVLLVIFLWNEKTLEKFWTTSWNEDFFIDFSFKIFSLNYHSITIYGLIFFSSVS